MPSRVLKRTPRCTLLLARTWLADHSRFLRRSAYTLDTLRAELRNQVDLDDDILTQSASSRRT